MCRGEWTKSEGWPEWYRGKQRSNSFVEYHIGISLSYNFDDYQLTSAMKKWINEVK